MSDWNSLLGPLAGIPRENGTEALAKTSWFLAEHLESIGLTPDVVAFTARPYVLRLAGLLILALGITYFRWMRGARYRSALLLAIVVPGALLAELEFQKPWFSWVGATTQYNVIAGVAAPVPDQRLILTAHYDTKTDLLDHVQRAPVDFLILPMVLLMIVGAATGVALGAARSQGRWFIAVPAWGLLLYGVANFAVFSAGALLPKRSHGALDDGAACAALLQVAERLERGPALERTRVDFLFVSGEEVGLQGSWDFARTRLAERELPTYVVNLDPLGASFDLGVVTKEIGALTAYAPNAQLLDWLDTLYRETAGKGLDRPRFGGRTDGRSYLAHGIPAVTLFSRIPDWWVIPRAMHSAADNRSRIDMAALERTTDYLEAAVRRFDRNGLR